MSNVIGMADFDLESFVSAPTVEQLDACRKDDLLRVAEHFQISVSRHPVTVVSHKCYGIIPF